MPHQQLQFSTTEITLVQMNLDRSPISNGQPMPMITKELFR